MTARECCKQVFDETQQGIISGSAIVLARGAPATAVLGVDHLAAFLAAALDRLAPGFGVDERLLDPRLSESSIHAIEAESAGNANLVRYFGRYLLGLCRDQLGQSLSFNRRYVN